MHILKLSRSLKERHEDELQKVRTEVDAANSAARDKDEQVNGLRSKLSDAQNNYDYMLREKTSLIGKNRIYSVHSKPITI